MIVSCRLFCVWIILALNAHAAAAAEIFLPKDGVVVSAPDFPGYKLERRGGDVFLIHEGKTRSIGPIAVEQGGAWPHILAFDLDFDKVPEFLLLQKADKDDSLYRLAHFKHGRNGGHYLFSDRLGFVFANPTFDPDKRVMTSRTSAGYSRVFVYKSPARKYYPHYQSLDDDFSTPSPPSEGGGVHILRTDVLLSFMPGALPMTHFPKGAQAVVMSTTKDGRWVYLNGQHDHAPRGWAEKRLLSFGE